jgi:phosphoglucomutase
MALALADKVQADIVLGTDPDSDRIAVAVRDTNGKMRLLNGNQSMSIMDAFLLEKYKQAGRLDGRQFIGSTIVSTDLVREIAADYQVDIKIGLTGFKWIAKMIREAEGKQEFIGGGEESFGYMVGDFVRDKDAVTSALLACEIAASAMDKGSNFYRELLHLYQRYGYYKEFLVALVKKGVEGATEITKMMETWRHNPPASFDGSTVVRVEDYLLGEAMNLTTGNSDKLHVPRSNVLIFQTEDGTKVAARPSGTEPKIKFYISVHTSLDKWENAEKIEKELDEKIKRIVTELNLES